MKKTIPAALLTEEFKQRVEDTGMTDAAVAAAIGVTKQYFSAVKNGKEAPSIKFLAGAVIAGLGQNFGDIARPNSYASGVKRQNVCVNLSIYGL